MSLGEFFVISIGTIFINNFVLSQFLGLCPFIGVSKKLDSVLGMGLAVIFVMTIASSVTYGINALILDNKILNWDLSFLRIVSFILVIASLVQLVEIVMKKMVPVLYDALGIYLPLITTNCAVMGAAELNVMKGYNFLEATLHGFMGGVSFLVAMFLMATIREKLEMVNVPRAFKGVPIAFISAGLMALAFLAADRSLLELFK